MLLTQPPFSQLVTIFAGIVQGVVVQITAYNSVYLDNDLADFAYIYFNTQNKNEK
jgi:hypothetical protein